MVTEGQPAAPGYFVYDAIKNRKDRALLDEEGAAAADDAAGARRGRGGGRRRPRHAPGGRLRRRAPRGLPERRPRRALRRVRRLRRRSGHLDRARLRRGRRAGGSHPARAHRLRRRPRLPGVTAAGHGRQPRARGARLPAQRRAASRRPGVGGRDLQLVDIRNPGELAAGVISESRALPLGTLAAHLDELDPAAPTVVYCAGGYRSSAGASLLRANGFTDVSDLLGGYAAWETLARESLAG